MNLELGTRVADQDGIEADVGRTKARLASDLPKGRVHKLTVEPQLFAGLDLATAESCGVLQGLKVGVGYRQTSECRLTSATAPRSAAADDWGVRTTPDGIAVIEC